METLIFAYELERKFNRALASFKRLTEIIEKREMEDEGVQANSPDLGDNSSLGHIKGESSVQNEANNETTKSLGQDTQDTMEAKSSMEIQNPQDTKADYNAGEAQDIDESELHECATGSQDAEQLVGLHLSLGSRTGEYLCPRLHTYYFATSKIATIKPEGKQQVNLSFQEDVPL
ncbi:uncharacterized protein N0V89_001583 [Didymosphaeria variabile]|uniref:Uncharacterized protein n=1 Tax=Didymosphaeria variabile TaxID=1932322 RepID=A0A9W8XWK0_9PLEO|nr:uncharacterized protein N0V89_001583 [Didymosphaeria variabile]KAJ4361014.1 hypothetical protein N0V89_001583 [Didymosphaeria variabile]